MMLSVVSLVEATRFLLLTILLCLLIKWIFNRKKPANYRLPPLVKEGWPVLGYWPFLGSKPHLEFFHLRQIYGNVYRVRIAGQEVVILNDYDSTKEFMMKDAFLGRPPGVPIQMYRDDPSIVDVNYQEWKDQRRYSLAILRDFGFGRNRMDQFVQDEAKIFVDEMGKFNGKPVEIFVPFACSVCNVILVLLTGRRFEYDVIARELLPNYFRASLMVMSQTTQQVYPRLQRLLFDIRLFTQGKLHNLFDLLYIFIKREIAEHHETLDNYHMRDYIDGYLQKIGAEKNKRSSFTDSNLRGNVQLWFTAAADTILATLEWSLLIMTRYPDVQKRVQQEIDDVIGRERHPVWDDRKNMPYTQAVIQEIQRWRTLLPLNVTRMALDDDTIQGFDIPHGTRVIANLWAVHNDPGYWTHPEEFRPERYLKNGGTSCQKSDHVIPFSVGRRNCPGETLANVTIFLYFTTILHQYNLHLPHGNVHTMDGKTGMLHYPTPYDLCLQAR